MENEKKVIPEDILREAKHKFDPYDLGNNAVAYEYYIQGRMDERAMTKTPDDVMSAIEAKYDKFDGNITHNTIVEIQREAALFGASLRPVIDWDELFIDFAEWWNGFTLSPTQIDIFDWFKGNLNGKAGSDAVEFCSWMQSMACTDNTLSANPNKPYVMFNKSESEKFTLDELYAIFLTQK